MVKSEDVEIEFIDGEYVIRSSLPRKSVLISRTHSNVPSLATLRFECIFDPFHSSTLEGFEGPGLGDTWQQHAAENSVIANQIGREDTLDRNPGFVNPQDITHIQNRHEEQAIPNMTISNSQYQFIIDSVDTRAEVPKADPYAHTAGSGQVYEIVQGSQMVEWTVENVQAGTGIEPSSPTGMTPAVTSWPGMADFKAHFMRLSDNPKHETWEVRLMIYI